MLLVSLGSRKPPRNQTPISDEGQDALIWWLTLNAGAVLIASVITFALAVIAIPFWRGLFILLAQLVLLVGTILFVRWRRKRQKARNSP